METWWIWLPALHRYRDLRTGRFVSTAQVIEWTDAAIAAADDAAQAAATLLANGTIEVGVWQAAVREELKDLYIQQYVLGRGGLAQMTAADWGSIGGMLRDQYRYLDGFAAEIAAGNLSEAQIRARLQMYFNSSREAYERGHARAYGLPPLPAYPGDGQTACRTNCHCAWHIEEGDDGWYCTWTLDPTVENCPDCQDNAAAWNPLFIPYPA